MGNNIIFIADMEIYEEIGQLLDEAEKEIIILSPWIQLTELTILSVSSYTFL